MPYEVANAGSCVPFSISCGLQEGYGDTGILHTTAEAESVIMAVLERSAAVGGYIPSGNLVCGECLYAWPGGSGSEPSVLYTGETKPEFPAPISQVRERLIELASALGSALGQSRVYVRLGGKLIVLQAEEAVLPTDKRSDEECRLALGVTPKTTLGEMWQTFIGAFR